MDKTQVLAGHGIGMIVSDGGMVNQAEQLCSQGLMIRTGRKNGFNVYCLTYFGLLKTDGMLEQRYANPLLHPN